MVIDGALRNQLTTKVTFLPSLWNSIELKTAVEVKRTNSNFS